MTRAVGILGLGHYVPEKIITNTDMEKLLRPVTNGLLSAPASSSVTLLLRKKQLPIWRTMLL